MFEQDYIMRMIHLSARAIVKVLYGKDIDALEELSIGDENSRRTAYELCRLIDEGCINEAENRLYASADTDGKQLLPVALMVYDYLNEKDDRFLEAYDFSREEIKSGLEDILKRCGMSGLSDILL